MVQCIGATSVVGPYHGNWLYYGTLYYSLSTQNRSQILDDSVTYGAILLTLRDTACTVDYCNVVYCRELQLWPLSPLKGWWNSLSIHFSLAPNSSSLSTYCTVGPEAGFIGIYFLLPQHPRLYLCAPHPPYDE